MANKINRSNKIGSSYKNSLPGSAFQQKGLIHTQDKVKSSRKIRKETQKVDNLRDNYLYENAYQQLYSMGGGYYSTPEEFKFDPTKSGNPAAGAYNINPDTKINRYVIKGSSGIHTDRQGVKKYKSKRGKIQSLKEDYYQLQLSQNPEQSRKESWKDTKKFIKEEVKPRVRSKFAKEHHKEGGLVTPVVDTGGAGMFYGAYEGVPGEQKVSQKSKHKLKSLEKSYLRSYQSKSRKEARQSVNKAWEERAKEAASSYTTVKDYKTRVKQDKELGYDTPRSTKKIIKKQVKKHPKGYFISFSTKDPVTWDY